MGKKIDITDLRPKKAEETAPEPDPVVSRCDGCRQRAIFSILLASGGVLTLCGHHEYRSREALAEAGAETRSC